MHQEGKQDTLAGKVAQVPAHLGSGAHQDKRRNFPRWAKSKTPRCPRHPSKVMRGHREPEPKVIAVGAYKAGTRMVYHCQVAGCHMVAIGEHTPYFGASVLELLEMSGL